MTKQKHFKERVRARMAKTGESYTTARRHVFAAQTKGESSVADLPHFPGIHPETTALLGALAHAGVTNPHNGEFFTEPMVFGIAGGIGAGVFHFYYAAEDFASFYIAGRHRWQESDAYLVDACLRFGVTPTVLESGGKKKAATLLADAVDATGCAIAWVDMGFLPYRGMSTCVSGGRLPRDHGLSCHGPGSADRRPHRRTGIDLARRAGRRPHTHQEAEEPHPDDFRSAARLFTA